MLDKLYVRSGKKLFNDAKSELICFDDLKSVSLYAESVFEKGIDYINATGELKPDFDFAQLSRVFSNKRKCDLIHYAKWLHKEVRKPREGVQLARSHGARVGGQIVASVFYFGAVWPNQGNARLKVSVRYLKSLLDGQAPVQFITD